MTCAKQFWKKMYTGWVMRIERQGNQGSTIPDTMCVVPIYSFLCECLLLYQDSVKFIMILMTPEPCSAHQYLHAPWSTVSDPFTPFLSQCNRITGVLKFIFNKDWFKLIATAYLGDRSCDWIESQLFIRRRPLSTLKLLHVVEGCVTCIAYNKWMRAIFHIWKLCVWLTMKKLRTF